MELYTLTNHFFLNKMIDRFFSLIWTERYSSAGDVQIVAPAIPLMINSLAPGTFLGLRGTKEIMVVDTQSINDGVLTVTGSSLIKFLNQRIAWFENPDYDATDTNPGAMFADFTSDGLTAGQFISNVVDMLVISPPAYASPYDDISLDWAREKINNLTLGHVDPFGGDKTLTFPIGPLYDGITQLASAQNVGIKLYLDSAHFNTGAYSLKFSTYRGRDRTSNQSNNVMIRFAPEFDSLDKSTEVKSNDTYKNVVYVSYKNKVTVHYPSYIGTPPLGFDRRVLRVEAPDIHLTDAHIPAFLERVAQAALSGAKESYSVDGTVLARTDYVFGVNYNLGDFVEVKGYSGLIVKARVAEYIRSQDQYGEQGYPTFDVLSVLDNTYEEDPVYTPEWSNSDPNYTGDTPPDSGVADLQDREMSPLTALEKGQADAWFYDTDRGYYTEDGMVYVAGAAVAGINGTTFNYPGSEVLLSNIPGDLVPDHDQPVRVMIDPVNSSEHFANGGWLEATVHTDGTVTLDAGNPAPSGGSSSGIANYAIISLLLSNISWPKGNYVPVSTPDTTSSVDDLVAGGDTWTNVNAKYVSRATRFHFKGSIEAGLSPNDIAPMTIPAALCPAILSGSLGGSPGDEFYWCAVVTDSGYAFRLGPRDGSNHPLFVLGRVDGNINSFYAKTHDGIGHGTGTTLSFNAGTPDIGVDYIGYSGNPSTTLPSSTDWRGSSYSATVNFNVSDIIDIEEPVEIPLGKKGYFGVEHAAISGDQQFAFIMGIMPGMNAYYKIVFTRDSMNNRLYMRLLYEVCGNVDQREQLDYKDLSSLVRPDGNVSHTFTVQFSTDPADVGVSEFEGGPLVDGYDYYRIPTDNISVFSDLKGSTWPGASLPPPWPGGKGDMGVHIPAGSGIEVFSNSIEGIGTFQPFILGDRIVLDGGGWPL